MHRSNLLGLTAVAIVVLAPGLAAANDKCKNVRFRVSNNHATGKPIQIVGVRYKDLVNNKTVSVNFANLDCAYQTTCVTPATDLLDIEGNNLKDIQFAFKYKERDRDWSDPTLSKSFEPDHKECRADRVYGAAPKGFVIGAAP